MGGARRSGRVAKEISILLFGTDTSGHVFSEETRMVVLSRHGAGILSRPKLAADEILTLRHGRANGRRNPRAGSRRYMLGEDYGILPRPCMTCTISEIT
jgi:hypothetical protein